MENSNAATRKVGHFSIQDTGVPNGSSDYKTLVLLHGFVYHRGVFARLLPLAPTFNTRIVLVNRRDYPDSDQYTEKDLAPLLSANADTPEPEAKANLTKYMKARARELYDFLVKFVAEEDIPTASIILAGWSFGGLWMLAFLANVSTFPVNDVELDKYIRRVVLYDSPHHALGYPFPSEYYHPMQDPSLAPGEGAKIFPSWISGYYTHGDSPSELEHRVPVSDPPPTITTMSPEDIESMLYLAPGSAIGSDYLLMNANLRVLLGADYRRVILFGPENTEGTKRSDDDEEEEATGGEWKNVQLRYIWCDRSVWELPWSAWAFQKELEEARQAGREMRDVAIVRLRGANHFYHWDQPERALRVLLSDDAAEEI